MDVNGAGNNDCQYCKCSDSLMYASSAAHFHPILSVINIYHGDCNFAVMDRYIVINSKSSICGNIWHLPLNSKRLFFVFSDTTEKTGGVESIDSTHRVYNIRNFKFYILNFHRYSTRYPGTTYRTLLVLLSR